MAQNLFGGSNLPMWEERKRAGFLDIRGSMMLPRSIFYLHTLTSNLRLKASVLQQMQEKKLRATVKHAYEQVPFYRRKFDNVGVRPSDIRTIEDLSKIPLTVNREIQATSLTEVTARGINFGKCTKRMTSGSTGFPLEVVLDGRTVDFQNALAARAYFENGMKPWHKMARFVEPGFDINNRWFQRLGLMKTEYVPIFDCVNRQANTIERLKPNVIRGYPSSLEILARFCMDNDKRIHPQLVFSGAELLAKETRRIINSAFQTKLSDLYASVEFGLMAWECEAHFGYHINVDGLVVEFIRNGLPVGPGERGKIVCTDLFNKVMPLIRYDIGDIGVPFDEQCACGRTLPLMKIVEGRTGDHLITLDGRVIPPIAFFPYPFQEVKGIKQFRIIQEKRDMITIQIVPKENFQTHSLGLDMARRNILDVFGVNMHVEFQILDKIERDPSGKLRKIISKVPVEVA